MMYVYISLAALLLRVANGQCSSLSRTDCNSFGFNLGCEFTGGVCQDIRTSVDSDYCDGKKQRKCINDKLCMFVNGQCISDLDKDDAPIKGTCYLAKDSKQDCRDTPYCAFQMPHGNMIKRDYHRKVDEECVWIDERLGQTLADTYQGKATVDDFVEYAKIDINKFCSVNTKKRDCIRKRYVAYPERLRFQLEENICQWNENQEVCRVNRVGAQYGQIVNETDTSLPQEDPMYVIADSRKPPKNRDFDKSNQFYETWDEYNNMCLALNDTMEALGNGCEERGCALFFDESKYDVTTQRICAGCDAVYCVPRFPDSSKYGASDDPYAAEWDDPALNNRFNYSYTQDTIDNWIGYLECEFFSPQWCNSVPGCNAKKDPACTKNGATCYICTGEPEIGGKRRRIDVDPAGITLEAALDPAGILPAEEMELRSPDGTF